MRRAFSLVETLVVSAVIALLIGIAVPALSHARRALQLTASSVLARETGGIHLAYAAEHDGRMFAGMIEDPKNYYYTSPAGRVRSYFETHITWSADIGTDYVPSGHAGEFNSPFDRLDEVWGDYQYSCTMTTQPQFWNRLTRMGPQQWTPPRASDAKFPSKKILTFDGVLWGKVQSGEILWKVKNPLVASFLDGSAEAIPEASPGYFKGDGVGDWPGAFHAGQTTDGLHTIDGIRGRDR